jgi:uncharacterized membrane-anchored protein YjiN (DUF445 family)
MGLPIPHTAIIPSNKDRVADNLAVFVRDHFLDPKHLLEKLAVIDPASRLGQWLSEPERVHAWAGMARGWVLEGLNLLDEAAVQKAIRDYVMERAKTWDASGSAGDILALLTRDGRHQQLLDGVLDKIGGFLGREEVKVKVSSFILKMVREEYPKSVWIVDLFTSVDDLSDSTVDKMARGVMDEVQKVLSQPGHPMRVQYEEWVIDYIERLRHDPEVVMHINTLKLSLIEHPAARDYVEGIWGEIHATMRLDLLSEDSKLGAHLEQALLSLGRKLACDSELRSVINAHVLSGAEKLVVSLREDVTNHIASTVKAWNDEELVSELELSVGQDLQIIRFSGTVVGGMIGVVLYGMSLALAHFL